MNKIKKILLVMMLALPMAAAAVYLFKTIDGRNGLISSQINCVLKDQRGYVWFGTPAGLYRFDGYTFKNFQSNSQDGSSLPDSYIISIQEMLDGNLWIETSAGFCVYHPQSESFERDMKQVYAQMGIEGKPNVVYIDRHKNFWASIPNKGVVAYNMQQQTNYEFGYTNDAHGIPQGTICSISECRDGAVLVYEDGRIVCCDIMRQQHTVWQSDFVAQQHLRKSMSLKAFADQMDNIWLYGQGTLMIYNKNANTWNTTFGERLGLNSSTVDHSVNGIAADRSGNIWIGSDRAGLLRTNVNNYEIESVHPRSINDNRTTEDNISIQSVYVDDTDLLWVGTEKSGVAYYGSNIYKFDANLNGDITAIAQSNDSTIWYGTGSHGVIGYNGPLTSSKVSCMATTPDGSLWVGSKQNGLTRIKNGTSKFYSSNSDSVRTLIDNHINALCSDKSGNLWIATNGGLQVFNPKMNTFSSYTRENGTLNTNTITALFYGSNNNMLIGTSEGLVILNLSTREKMVLTGNKTNIQTFTNNYVTQIYEDSRGLIWIGTREGINILNLETDQVNYLTEKDGLCNNSVCGIAEDKNHNIWVSTSNGITRTVIQRNHEDGTFAYGLYNYSVYDGLQSNEFNMGSILTRHDGIVLFGGLYGVNWVRQASKDEQESLPRVMLTQLYIGEEEIQTGHEYDGRVILTSALNEISKIELANSQNTLTIKFAAGNYNQGERLQFMYWMEGLDNDWRNGDALLHGVKFNKLSSGEYTLHVKAVSADGAVSNQERTLEITIDRPWWLSWWMLSVYVIIAILILLIAFINFVNFFFALVPVRMRAVNTYKVYGASRGFLVMNFIFEAVGTVAVALGVAALIVLGVMRSSVAALLSAPVSMGQNVPVVVTTVVVALVAAVAASLYPSLYITNFQVAMAVKGSFGGSAAGRRLRNGLMGVQFVISIALIICASFIRMQHAYMMNYDMGFDKEQLLTGFMNYDLGWYGASNDAFENRLRNNPDIKDIAWAAGPLVNEIRMGWGREYKGRSIHMQCYPVSPGFLQFMGIPITEGRDFLPSDDQGNGVFIINEQGQREYDVELNDVIKGHNGNAEVVGICRDFHFKPLQYRSEPFVFP